MSTQIEPLLTIADLDAMPDDGNRYEIIEGELFVSRSPFLTHQRVSGNLFMRIRNHLVEDPIGEVLATPGVIFSEFSGVIPDIVFFSNERRDEIASTERIMGAPDLIIEIISPGSENDRRDRVAKRQLYGKYGVKEYWVVDPLQRTIEIYCRVGRNLKLQTVLREQDELTSSLLPGFSCKVADIFLF
ncbi:MAG: Uma2 family endonuclease [Acidobacteriota bacterium]